MKPLLCFVSTKTSEGHFLINVYPVFLTSSSHDTIKIFSQSFSLPPALPFNTFSSLLYLKCFPSPCNISSSLVYPSRCRLCPLLALFQLVAWVTVGEWVDSLVKMQPLLPNRVEVFWVLLPLLSMETLTVSVLSILIVTLRLLNFCQINMKLDDVLKKYHRGMNSSYKPSFLRKYAKKIVRKIL